MMEIVMGKKLHVELKDELQFAREFLTAEAEHRKERLKKEEAERKKRENEEREKARKEQLEAERKAKETAEAANKAAEEAKKKMEAMAAAAESEKLKIQKELEKAQEAAAAADKAQKEADRLAEAEAERRKAVEEEERRIKEKQRKMEEEILPPPPPPPPVDGDLNAISEENAFAPPPPPSPGAFDEILASDRKKARQQIKDAIKSGDVSALESILSSADGTLKASRTLKLGKAMVEKLKKGALLMINLKKAVENLDRPKMKELLEEARALDVEVDETILNARKLCYGMLDSDFRSLQFKLAIEQKDSATLKNLISISQDARTSKLIYTLMRF
jgi:hypothetical protein